MQESRILQKSLHHNKRNLHVVVTPAPGSLYQLNSLSWAALRWAEVQKLVNRCSAKHSTPLTPMEKRVVRQ